MKIINSDRFLRLTLHKLDWQTLLHLVYLALRVNLLSLVEVGLFRLSTHPLTLKISLDSIDYVSSIPCPANMTRLNYLCLLPSPPRFHSPVCSGPFPFFYLVPPPPPISYLLSGTLPCFHSPVWCPPPLSTLLSGTPPPPFSLSYLVPPRGGNATPLPALATWAR
jgi:hypothetical protein